MMSKKTPYETTGLWLRKEFEHSLTNIEQNLKKDGIEFSTKQQSELMSEIAQASFLNVLKEKNINAEVKVGVNVADIYIEGVQKIKTCGAEKWQGGSFSKRPGLYLSIKLEISRIN